MVGGGARNGPAEWKTRVRLHHYSVFLGAEHRRDYRRPGALVRPAPRGESGLGFHQLRASSHATLQSL